VFAQSMPQLWSRALYATDASLLNVGARKAISAMARYEVTREVRGQSC
jgi:hypothetical protein